MRKNFRWIFILGLIVLIIIVAIYASAATNTVPNTSLGRISTPLSTGDVLPTECAGMTIGGKAELFLGTTGNDTHSSGNRDDCLLGGAGNDILKGGQGNDVIISGPGIDDIDGGPGNNTCYVCVGVDTYKNCNVVNSCP
jgi:Ca2+-binding RTX toxin-like protein